MCTLLHHINQFIRNIDVTDRQEESIKNSYEHLEYKLLNAQLGVQEVVLTGSYMRDTMIRPVDDIDLLAIINWPYGKQFPSPQSELSKFRSRLNKVHDYEDKAVQDRPCITVELSDKKFDILPTLRVERVLYIPNQTLTGWMAIADPEEHTRRLNAIDAKYHGMVKKVVKAVKHWKRENRQNIPSFHVEEVAIQIFNMKSIGRGIRTLIFCKEEIRNLEEGIKAWFSGAGFYLNPECFKSKEEYWKVRDRIKNENEKFLRIDLCNCMGYEVDSKSTWREIFGSEFSTY